MTFRLAPLVISILHLCFSQSLQAASTTAKLNGVVHAYRLCKLECLEGYWDDFKQKHPDVNSQVLEVVYGVLAAEKILQRSDEKSTAAEHLYREAIDVATRSKQGDLLIWAQTRFGVYYYRYSELGLAMPYFLKASNKLGEIDLSGLLEADEVLKWNAYFFGAIQDFEKEQFFLNQALEMTRPNSENHTEILNNLAMSYLNANEVDQAEKFLNQTRDLALRNKQEVRYAKVLGALSRVAFLRGNFALAEALLLKDIAISKQNNSHRNTMYAQLLLAQLYVQQKAWNAAKNTIEEAKHYVQSKSHLASFEMEINAVLLEIAVAKRDVSGELVYRRSIDSLDRIVAQTDGTNIVNQLQLQVQKKEIQAQLEAERVKLEKATAVQITAVVVGILLLLISILIFVIYRRKLKLQSVGLEKNLLRFQLDQAQSEQRLYEAQSDLASYKVYLSEKNVQLKRLEFEVKKRSSIDSAVVKKSEGNLQELLDSHLMTKEKWGRFKAAFIAEQSQYYQHLISNFPDLTEANLRMIMLQKLGFKNQEIAQILVITVEAVKKSKQRLKKRYAANYIEIFKEF